MIICVCGSWEFAKEVKEAGQVLTKAGESVLVPGVSTLELAVETCDLIYIVVGKRVGFGRALFGVYETMVVTMARTMKKKFIFSCQIPPEGWTAANKTGDCNHE